MRRSSAFIIRVGLAAISLAHFGGPMCAQTPCGRLDVDPPDQEGFGLAMAVDGDRLVVGAPDAPTPNGPGSAYVFLFDGSEWLLEQRLLAADGDDWDQFGVAVAIAGDLIVVGADQDEPEFWTGSAYIFRHDGNQWSQEQKLTASNGAEVDKFGSSVGVAGNWVLVGADSTNHESVGSVYAYEFDGDTWVERAEIRPSDAALGLGYLFGSTLAMRDGLALIGAHWDDNATDQGAVYMFRLEENVWVERQKIVASTAEDDQNFGIDVRLDGDSAVVGTSSGRQSFYVLNFDGQVWTEVAELAVAGAQQGDGIGRNVAIFGDLIIAGASGDDEAGDRAGAAYIFRRDGGVWTESIKLLAADAAEIDHLGNDVAIVGDTAFAGANGVGNFAGAGYVFRDLHAPPDCNENHIHDACDIASASSADENGNGVPDECECDADLDGSLDVGFGDILAVLAAWGECPKECPEDLDGSGDVGFGDLLAVLASWGPCRRGACCFDDTSCLDAVYEGDCLAAGGAYQGDDTTCAETCLGACCFQDRSCQDHRSESGCASDGGFYQGDGSVCGEFCQGGCGWLVDAPLKWVGSPCDDDDSCPLRNNPDVQWEVTIPSDGDWTFSTCGSDSNTDLYVDTTTCCGDEYAADGTCGDDGEVTLALTAGQIVYVTLETNFPVCDEFVLVISSN